MKKEKINFYKGFTIIELLVVVAIIGLLSSIVLVSLNSARNKAADAKSKAELSKIRDALLMYQGDNGNLPGMTITGPDCLDPIWDACSASSAGSLSFFSGRNGWKQEFKDALAPYLDPPNHSFNGASYIYYYVVDVDFVGTICDNKPRIGATLTRKVEGNEFPCNPLPFPYYSSYEIILGR